MAQGIMQKVTNDSGTLYCKMPDGTLIQWGVDGGYQSTKRRDFTINFPIPFLNVNYVVSAASQFASEANPYECLITVKRVSGEQCILHQVNATDVYCNALMWIAIGRWK